jgi:methionyl-tRNA formyltransferase
MMHQIRLEENPLVKEIQVICPSDRKVGKGKRHDPVPVKQYAMKNGIIVHHTPPKLYVSQYHILV